MRHEPDLPFIDRLLYRNLERGKDYWIEDNVLPNALEVAQRCVAKTTWRLGSPWRPEPWPGMRAPDALTPPELARVEDCLRLRLGVNAVRPQDDNWMGVSGHNHVHLVGGGEGVARPHVDSAKVCDYAGVLYLHPAPPTPHCGTSFYRLRLPDGTLGGNVCPPEYESISEIPGMKYMDLTMWQEELEVPYVFNRLLLYKSDIVHSATAYFGWGHELASKRMAVVFFWKVAD
jgi:hypothetical protein